jgi:cytidylate kinase
VVVTIDGPSGVGKSTVTRLVADELGVPHLDTGAIYRAATLAVLNAEVEIADEPAVIQVVAAMEVEYGRGQVWLDGDEVTADVRSPAVTGAVSAVSAIAAVRDICVELQREWVRKRGGSAVVEGRDIGSVVFPDAPVKVFLTAPPEVRAARRAGDREVAGVAISDIASDMARRDRHDSNREVSPLQPAADAVVLDTAALDAQGVVDAVLALVDAANREDRYAGREVSDLE